MKRSIRLFCNSIKEDGNPLRPIVYAAFVEDTDLSSKLNYGDLGVASYQLMGKKGMVVEFNKDMGIYGDFLSRLMR